MKNNLAKQIANILTSLFAFFTLILDTKGYSLCFSKDRLQNVKSGLLGHCQVLF